MSILFIIAPVAGWVLSGIIKFIINFIKFKNEAFKLIGNGGFPSTHTTIVTTCTMLLGFKEGFNTSIFGLGLTVLFLTVIDAMGIRNVVGSQSVIINKFINKNKTTKLLRERQGHNLFEVMGGFVLGLLIAYLLNEVGGIIICIK